MCSPVGLNGTTGNLRRLKPLRMLSGRASEIALAERLILLKQAQDQGEDLFSSHSEPFEYDDLTTGAVSTTSSYFAIPDTFRPLRDANSREIDQLQREQAANMRSDCVVALPHYPKFANEAGSSGHAHPESPQQTIHIATLPSKNVHTDSDKTVCKRPQPSSTTGKLESCCQSKDETCGLPVRERVESWRRKQLDWAEKVSEQPLSDSDTDSDDEASSSTTESDSSGPPTEPDDVPRKLEHASGFISDMALPRGVATRASSMTPLQPLHPYTLTSGCAFIHPSLAKGYAYPVDNATKSLRMELHTATQPQSTPRSAALRRPGFGALANLERPYAGTERAPGRTAASAT